VRAWIATGEIRASELELRLSERVLAGLSSPGRALRPFTDLGVRLVVDEFGRGVSSLPRLARMPLWGLQLDRSLANAARDDAVAGRAAAAALAVARSLELTAIVSGIDTPDDLIRWKELGATQGLGDHFSAALRSASGNVAQRADAPSAKRLRR
jgi:EAL domain-containing protein (putative c-di-GMP-specific phosphodiesterase class I)